MTTPYLDKFGEDEPDYVANILENYWSRREDALKNIEGQEEKEQEFEAEFAEEKALFIALREYGALKDVSILPFESSGALMHNKSIIDRIASRSDKEDEELIKVLKGAAAEIDSVLVEYINQK